MCVEGKQKKPTTMNHYLSMRVSTENLPKKGYTPASAAVAQNLFKSFASGGNCATGVPMVSVKDMKELLMHMFAAADYREPRTTDDDSEESDSSSESD
jgi:hypothetical protein